MTTGKEKGWGHRYIVSFRVVSKRLQEDGTSNCVAIPNPNLFTFV